MSAYCIGYRALNTVNQPLFKEPYSDYSCEALGSKFNRGKNQVHTSPLEVFTYYAYLIFMIKTHVEVKSVVVGWPVTL